VSRPLSLGWWQAETGKSFLGTMLSQIDTLCGAITGQNASEDIPADVRVNDAVMQINTMMQALGEDPSPAVGSAGVALLNPIRSLKQKLDASRTRKQQIRMRTIRFWTISTCSATRCRSGKTACQRFGRHADPKR
jgi:hypothetical protein